MTTTQYVPMGWTEAEYKTSASYNPFGLNNDKADPFKKTASAGAAMGKGGELDFGEATIHDFRLERNEVVYGD